MYRMYLRQAVQAVAGVAWTYDASETPRPGEIQRYVGVVCAQSHDDVEGRYEHDTPAPRHALELTKSSETGHRMASGSDTVVGLHATLAASKWS